MRVPTDISRIPAVDPRRRRSALARPVMRFGLSSMGQAYLKHISPRVDPPLTRWTRGRISSLLIVPPVLLKTVGAKSGEPRITPLTYFTDGDRVVLIASNYGGRRNPGWYHNVKAKPEVTLQAGGVEGRYRGTEVTGSERDHLYALAKQHSANYAKYERMTVGVREIPVLVFAPVDLRDR